MPPTPPAPKPESGDARTPGEATAGMDIHAPTRGNKKLEKLLAAVNADEQVKGRWQAAAVNAQRLRM